MTTAIAHTYEDVSFYAFGYALWGKPSIPVYSYWIDGVLIDTGPTNAAKSVLNTWQSMPIRSILLTHHHEDHSGNAEALRLAHQVPVYAGEQTRQLLHTRLRIKPYQRYYFGTPPVLQESQPLPTQIHTQKYVIEPIFTPGHAPDHYAYLVPSRGWLFSGDLYIGLIRYARRDENIPEMIRSIRHILTHDFEVIFCAHNPQLKNGKAKFASKLQYLEDFAGQVKLHQAKGMNIAQIRQALGKKEVYFAKLFTFNDVGVDFLIRSVMIHA